MTAKDPYRLTASEVVSLTSSGKLTVEDYAKSLLSRVHERDSVVHAWGESSCLIVYSLLENTSSNQCLS